MSNHDPQSLYCFKKHDNDKNGRTNQKKIASTTASARIILLPTVHGVHTINKQPGQNTLLSAGSNSKSCFKSLLDVLKSFKQGTFFFPLQRLGKL